MRSRDLIQQLLLAASDVYSQTLNLRDLFAFFEMQPTIVVARGRAAGAAADPRGLRVRWTRASSIRAVSAGRCGTSTSRSGPASGWRWSGENGAGKTTITKLIARLYEPTEGRVLLDGRDLRDYDLLSLRQAIGVIFQDFVRYDMRFDENVGVGEIETTRAVPRAAERGDGAARMVGPGRGTVTPITDAADRSLAASLLPKLPHGYRQMLGRRFADGVDLSGGEWQKIALARAYMRTAQLLILDEPTAALDARAEYEVFVRFAELMAGRMAIIISHRFSTVRMADRIIMLRNGEIAEEGTHDELVARGAAYSELFEMQAAGYR